MLTHLEILQNQEGQPCRDSDFGYEQVEDTVGGRRVRISVGSVLGLEISNSGLMTSLTPDPSDGTRFQRQFSTSPVYGDT